MKDEDEIEAAADRAATASRQQSQRPGRSFEEGVAEALDWVLGNQDDDPTE